jgi:hypothetical protein
MSLIHLAMVYNAYIVDCVRTAGGRKNGALAGWHAADLGAQVGKSCLSCSFAFACAFLCVCICAYAFTCAWARV